jgi:hypothetical protein
MTKLMNKYTALAARCVFIHKLLRRRRAGIPLNGGTLRRYAYFLYQFTKDTNFQGSLLEENRYERRAAAAT